MFIVAIIHYPGYSLSSDYTPATPGQREGRQREGRKAKHMLAPLAVAECEVAALTPAVS